MPKYKLVKATCKKTGKKFVMQVSEEKKELVGCFTMDEQAYDALATQIDVSTINKCAPCPTCGTTKPFSCEHQYKATGCPMDRAATRACLSCKHVQVIYGGGAAVDSPYGQWAGTSVIEGVELDEHGNPKGSQYDLAKDGAFKGYTVNVLWGYSPARNKSFTMTNALNKKGFTVNHYVPPFSDKQLEQILAMPNSQLWIISNDRNTLSDKQIKSIYNYAKDGYGVYIWGDNEFYYIEANALLVPYFSTKLEGNYMGLKILGVQKAADEPGIIPNHVLTTGLVSFYEGHSVSHFETPGIMQPLMYNSERRLLALYYDKEGMRVLADGGFTRLWDEFMVNAGTDRYVTNAAAWLANIERFGYNKKV